MISTLVGFILLLLAHAAAGICSSPLKYSKKTTCIIWGSWVVLQTAMLAYTEFVLKNVFLQFFTGFFLSLIGQYAIFFATTKGRLAQRVFIMLTYSIFFCICTTLFTMVRGTFQSISPILLSVIHGLMLFVVLYYFLRFVCPLCQSAAKNITTGWSPLIFVNIVFLITIILSSIFPVRLMSFREPAVFTFVFISGSIMSVYPVIFSNINSLSEAASKREAERQNRLLLAQIEAENAQLAADRQARHDRRHHNLVMLEFANNNDIESIRQYLSNLVESEVEIWGESRFCDHMTVNTVLTVYNRRARESDIPVKISANVSRDLEIAPQDLVIIIANLFENAINACQKLKLENKPINISIRENARRLLIRIENPCREKMGFDESLYGIGIRSVIAATNKYDGMYDFSAEDGIFSSKVTLNLK